MRCYFFDCNCFSQLVSGNDTFKGVHTKYKIKVLSSFYNIYRVYISKSILVKPKLKRNISIKISLNLTKHLTHICTFYSSQQTEF